MPYNIYGTNKSDTLYGADGRDFIYGFGGNDSLFGGWGLDVLVGGDGNDYLDGGAEADILAGDDGSDVLNGGTGADQLIGGDGFDYAVYDTSTVGVMVNLMTGSGYGGTATGDQLSEIEGIVGSDHADWLRGDNGSNYLSGGGQADVLDGAGGNDDLFGGVGHDTLKGGDGADNLYGGKGDDWLNGGSGRDDLYSGAGVDTFSWWYIDDTGATQATADHIWDFSFAEGDRIDLHYVDADAGAAGDQAFSFIGAAGFSGTPGEVRYYYSGGDTYLEMQTDTSPDVDGLICVEGLHTPDADWFVL
jgi:Ca2+-binding RTX toxin-like protein